MIQKILLPFLLFVTASCFSQKILQVTYKEIRNIDTINVFMISDGINSNYYKLERKINRKRSVTDHGNMNATIIAEQNITIAPQNFFTTLSNNTAYWQIDTNKNELLQDDMPARNWQINYDKQKKIGNYSCIEATASYRGSEIVAYFTPELPYHFGPNKTKDLPGLILELYTVETNPTRWIASKIEFVNISELTNPIKPEMANYTIKSFKEYEINRIKERDEKNNLMSKREAERGVKHTVAVFRAGLEKIYEWETN